MLCTFETTIFNSLTHSMEQSPSLEINSCSVKNFSAFYGIRMFNFVFVRKCHCSLSWATLIQFTTWFSISLKLVSI